ncbi:MAG: hypothetical protein AAF585_25330, partial [Verrucomicrobiota bacterium]
MSLLHQHARNFIMATGAILDLKLGWTGSSTRVRQSSARSSPAAAEIDICVEKSDNSVIKMILGGDPDSYAILIERYRGKILGTASRFARNRAELEDLSQETLPRLQKNL